MTTPDDIQIVRHSLEGGLRLHEYIKGANVDGLHPHQLASHIREALSALDRIAAQEQRAYAAGQESMRERAAIKADELYPIHPGAIRALEILPYGGEG